MIVPAKSCIQDRNETLADAGLQGWASGWGFLSGFCAFESLCETTFDKPLKIVTAHFNVWFFSTAEGLKKLYPKDIPQV